MRPDSVSNDYPPAPWALRGQMYCSVWMVPAERVQVHLDPAFELLTIAGRACVAACFVDYQEGSVLTYGEEAISVEVEHVGNRRLYVPARKTRRDRYVDLLPVVRTDIREWMMLAGIRSGLMFPRPDGGEWGDD